MLQTQGQMGEGVKSFQRETHGTCDLSIHIQRRRMGIPYLYKIIYANVAIYDTSSNQNSCSNWLRFTTSINSAYSNPLKSAGNWGYIKRKNVNK